MKPGSTKNLLLRLDPELAGQLQTVAEVEGRTVSDVAREAIAALDGDERAALLRDLVGRRANRRHRPGRGLEALRYRFEIVSDYGAFRDLQRHRMLTVEWQPLSPVHGYVLPQDVVLAGLERPFREAMERSEELWSRLQPDLPHESQYAVCFAHRIRYVLQMNAREAMHLIELRSSPQGHVSYRATAQEMWRQIRDVAGHRAIADAMTFVDFAEVDLERLQAERRAERKRQLQSSRNEP